MTELRLGDLTIDQVKNYCKVTECINCRFCNTIKCRFTGVQPMDWDCDEAIEVGIIIAIKTV